MEYKNSGKWLLVLSVLSALVAAVDFLSLLDAPLGLGANSWMLVATALGIYGVAVKQWKSN